MSCAECMGCKKHAADDLRTGTAEVVAPFEVSAAKLGDLTVLGKEELNMSTFTDMGAGAGIAAKLRSDVRRGITADAEDVERRLEAFGENRYPAAGFESWWSLFFDCFKDLILIILLVAAIVSLVVGSIEDPSKGFVDGLAILLAVFIVATVTATNDYNKQLQFRALQDVSDARIEVQAVRNGVTMTVHTQDLLVGDLVHLDTGAKVPADGVVVRSSDLVCNESAMTGESDDKHKDAANHPILLSGSQVIAGNVDYIVTGVGIRSLQGQIMQDVAAGDGETPLQVKLDRLATLVGYVGVIAAIGTFVAMMIIRATGGQSHRSWASWTIHSFLYSITIIVVAIPEGLPLAVTISLAYSTRKMLADQNLIRHLAACETMGGATDICSDKTGTLTENRMTVVQSWIGGTTVSFPNTEPVINPSDSSNARLIPAALLPMMRDQLALNSTAVTITTEKGKRDVKGSKTEGAGVMLVESLGYDVLAMRSSATDNAVIVKQYAFSSDRKMMSTIVALPDGRVRLFTTGGSDFILARCTTVQRLPSGAALDAAAEVVPLTPAMSEYLVNDVIVAMAKQSLRTLGLAYRDFASKEAMPADWETNAPESGMTLYAVLGIKDPLRADVAESVATCQRAGVTVRMVTGDNKITATAIAKECGILREGGMVMEGPDFRALTPAQLDEVLPHLVVLARSSPRDKNILVRRLNGNLPRTREEWEKEHPDADFEADHARLLPGFYDEWVASRKVEGRVYKAVVGVTGDGTNDAPALKAADVGLSMGISGTQVAMDASDIVILDDRFSSIVRAVLWGRSVYDNVQKFLQFQLTVNVVALCITFIAACIQKDPPLNPVMMLWVNLIMDTMGALALGTEPPTLALLDRLPYNSTASLVLPRMWRHIFAQSAYQFTTLMVLLTIGADRFGVTPQFLAETGKYLNKGKAGHPNEEDVSEYISTFIFNTFVFAQVFNEFNARSLTDKWNVYTDLAKSRMFLGIILVTGGLQAILCELGGDAVRTTGLTPLHWLYTLLIAAITIPLGIVMRFIPVPSRPRDFAKYHQSRFYAAMDARSGVASSEAVAVGASTHKLPTSGSARLDLSKAGVAGTGAAETGIALTPVKPAKPAVDGPLSPTDGMSLVADAHCGHTPVATGAREGFTPSAEAGKA